MCANLCFTVYIPQGVFVEMTGRMLLGRGFGKPDILAMLLAATLKAKVVSYSTAGCWSSLGQGYCPGYDGSILGLGSLCRPLYNHAAFPFPFVLLPKAHTLIPSSVHQPLHLLHHLHHPSQSSNSNSPCVFLSSPSWPSPAPSLASSQRPPRKPAPRSPRHPHEYCDQPHKHHPSPSSGHQYVLPTPSSHRSSPPLAYLPITKTWTHRLYCRLHQVRRSIPSRWPSVHQRQHHNHLDRHPSCHYHHQQAGPRDTPDHQPRCSRWHTFG